MRKELLSLTKDTAIYGVSTVIGRFLNFLLVPFYVNVLASTAEYGISTSLYAYIAFLNVIYPLGLEGAFFRYASRGEQEQGDDAQDKRYFSAPFNVILVFGFLLSVVFVLLVPHLVDPIFFDPKTDIEPMRPMLETILLYGVGILFFDSLAIIPFARLRLERRAKHFATLKLINIIVTLALNFIFILGLGIGVEGIFLANLVASVLTFILLIPSFAKYLELRFDRAVLKKMLPFGLTNVPAHIGAIMVQVINRPTIQAFLGLGMLGVFQANYRMGFTMMIFVSLFEYAWRPFFMRQHKTDDARARQIFAKVFTYFMLVSLVAFLLLSFFLPYILTTPIFGRSLLRADYFEGIPIIPFILLAYVFQGAYTNFIAGIYIKEKNKSLPLITGLGAVVNILGNITMIPVFGMMGAAYATLASYIVMSIAIYRVSNNAYKVPYEWGRVFILFVVVTSSFVIERIVLLGKIITDEPATILLRSGLFVITIISLFLFGFFSSRELALIKEVGRKFSRQKQKKPDGLA